MIQAEKLAQAKSLVASSDLDVWLTFVRETFGGSDPVLPLILEGGLTWQSALMVTRSGKAIAVVGNYDADPLRAAGTWDEVVPYVQSIREPLREVIVRECGGSGRIGINTSIDDVKADGLTHGMYTLLEEILGGIGTLHSAADLVMALRGQKTPSEIEAMREAIRHTDELFALAENTAGIGVSERSIYREMQNEIARRGLGYGWDPAGNPIVNSGPDSMIGHGIPSETVTLQPGHIFHIDLGVVAGGYSSDIQRCWYVSAGEEVPEDVIRAMEAVNRAISAGASLLHPGALGWRVDEAARASIVADGYPEYLHALGHQVGRVAHDGGAILGPRWDRYGRTPSIPVKEGEVYTLELGVTLPSRGYLGLEEMVVVTASGCEFLSDRQLTMPVIQKA